MSVAPSGIGSATPCWEKTKWEPTREPNRNPEVILPEKSIAGEATLEDFKEGGVRDQQSPDEVP